jgi:predicted RNA binding protein YcfA (HicA-like mRNA interferase family)
MKLPRDLSGMQLASSLRTLDYEILHQMGSHLICRTQRKGEHTEPIPNDKPLKVGTLSSILLRVAAHEGISKSELIRLLKL